MIAPIRPSITFMESLKICMKNYCNFKGRGRRSEFWPFYIVIVIIFGILYTLTLAFSHEEKNKVIFRLTITSRIADSNWFYVVSALLLIIILATILPLLAASTRRLHDAGNSGYWNFLFLLTFIGTIILWFLWLRDSEIRSNTYGPATKYNFGMNDPFINNGNIQPIFQNPVVQPGAYPQQNNPEPPQPNINQVGERINQNPEQPINNIEEIPINQNTEKPIDNNEKIELFEKPQKPMDNQEQIQINQNQQQPNINQGQYISVAQPNMAPQVNPQGQP